MIDVCFWELCGFRGFDRLVGLYLLDVVDFCFVRWVVALIFCKLVWLVGCGFRCGCDLL